MGRRRRHLPRPWQLVEITDRTIQSRYLLKPGPTFNDLLVGVLGRAQSLFPVRLHSVVCASNHFHLLISSPDSDLIARFMDHVKTNLSKEGSPSLCVEAGGRAEGTNGGLGIGHGPLKRHLPESRDLWKPWKAGPPNPPPHLSTAPTGPATAADTDLHLKDSARSRDIIGFPEISGDRRS